MTLHPTITPRPGILEIAPYVGGASHAAGANRAIKLSSNENPLGPSPLAVEAFRAAAPGLALYPEGGALALREAIAAVHGVEAARLICGAGSDEIISFLCSAYTGPGDEVLYSAHGFLMYRISALAAGATPVSVPETDLTADVDALIAGLTERTRLVFLANPNNPTGTLVSAAEIARLADALPPRALLVLDLAYAEYVWEAGREPAMALARDRDNVVVTRTFSKVYGLAALRLGWAYGPEHVIDVLNRVRGPFNTNAPSQAAGVAAIRDRAYVADCVHQNGIWRDWLAARLAAAGFPCVTSHGNFLLVETGGRAADLDGWLKTRGIVVRRMEGYGLPSHLRISIGTGADCQAVAEAVDAFAARTTP